MELAILSGSTVSLTIMDNSTGRIYQYSSEPWDEIVERFQNFEGEYLHYNNDHYDQIVPGKASSYSVGNTMVKMSGSLAPANGQTRTQQK